MLSGLRIIYNVPKKGNPLLCKSRLNPYVSYIIRIVIFESAVYNFFIEHFWLSDEYFFSIFNIRHARILQVQSTHKCSGMPIIKFPKFYISQIRKKDLNGNINLFMWHQQATYMGKLFFTYA